MSPPGLGPHLRDLGRWPSYNSSWPRDTAFSGCSTSARAGPPLRRSLLQQCGRTATELGLLENVPPRHHRWRQIPRQRSSTAWLRAVFRHGLLLALSAASRTSCLHRRSEPVPQRTRQPNAGSRDPNRGVLRYSLIRRACHGLAPNTRRPQVRPAAFLLHGDGTVGLC